MDIKGKTLTLLLLHREDFFNNFPSNLDNIESLPANEPLESTQNALNIFIVLIIITIIGTVLASPAATLADTATLEKLGKSNGPKF